MIGISFGTYGITGVSVAGRRGNYTLESSHSVPFYSLSDIRDEGKVLEQVLEALKTTGKKLRVSLSPQYADLQLVRLKTKPHDPDELKRVLCWKALGQKSNPEDYVIDFQELEGAEPGTFVVEFIDKRLFERIMNTCSRLKFAVEVMDLDPLNVFSLFYDRLQAKGAFKRLVGLIYLGEQFSSLTLFDHGVLCAYRRFRLGGRDFTEEIMRKKCIGLDKAEEFKRANLFFPVGLDDPRKLEDSVLENFPFIRETCFRLVQEIKASLISYSYMFDGREVGYLYMSGGPAGFDRIDRYLTMALETGVEVLNPLDVVSFKGNADTTAATELETVGSLKKDGRTDTGQPRIFQFGSPAYLAPVIGACLREG